MPLTRRQVLGSMGALSAGALVSGCGGFTRSDPATGGGDLTFTT